MLGFPLFVGHAIDVGFGFFTRQDLALLFSRRDQPLRQAIAAKARQVHQIKVLHVGTGLQVCQQAAEGGGFESGLLISLPISLLFNRGHELLSTMA
jgi:hypothetical protein